ncbi:DUF1993 family protein [Catenovulum sp. SX2]|uniref:DUF1993 family protein n=1 Tax=Catenovulum sp. SX2 TaxID=3398614 RepID=UPI003F86767B
MTNATPLKSMQNFALHYLPLMKTLGEQIQQHNSNIWQQRPFDDMFAAHTQWRICCNFILRGFAPLLNKQWPDDFNNFENSDDSWQGLLQQWQKVSDYVMSLEVSRLTRKNDEEVCTDKAGFATVSLPPDAFINQYIIPNFCFHFSMLYLTAKQNGVSVSKGHFDGYHKYPANFSFEQE